MGFWDRAFRTKRQRERARNTKRRDALLASKTAVRRERRAIIKRQRKADELRAKAVEHERQGRPDLARQMVRQFVQLDKESIARTLAVNNMEYAVEQVQMKDNFQDFVSGMSIVAQLEQLAKQSTDPERVREQLAEMAQASQDLLEPWTETQTVECAAVQSGATLTAEEREAYGHVTDEAAALIESDRESNEDEIAAMDRELEQKMDEALA